MTIIRYVESLTGIRPITENPKDLPYAVIFKGASYNNQTGHVRSHSEFISFRFVKVFGGGVQRKGPSGTQSLSLSIRCHWLLQAPRGLTKEDRKQKVPVGGLWIWVQLLRSGSIRLDWSLKPSHTNCLRVHPALSTSPRCVRAHTASSLLTPSLLTTSLDTFAHPGHVGEALASLGGDNSAQLQRGFFFSFCLPPPPSPPGPRSPNSSEAGLHIMYTMIQKPRHP